MFAMNLALVANNIGLMWVAIELATLTTVLMVGIYRTHEALEAAWKYFILGSVGIALALFGTILVYLAARAGGRRGHGRHGVDRPGRPGRALRSRPAQPRLRLPAARLRHQGRAWRRCTPGCPTPTPRARRRSRRCSRACCSTSRSTRSCASRCCSRPTRARSRPGPLMVTMGLVSLVFAALHALPAARHQAHVRLLLDRAHGHHHLRLRHGRPARQLRRPAAHDHAQPDQVGDLLRASATSRRSRARSGSPTSAA